MMEGSDAASFLEVGVDFESANAARMYDYYLGGAHNFAVDRERADAAIAAHPQLPYMARTNRTFLRHVVRWALDNGINQFLDLGSGVPTVGNVHEVALMTDPAARVAYVDFEPVAVAHAAAIIEDQALPTVTVTRADAREPSTVLAAPGVAGLLDFDRPVAVLAVALFSFIAGDPAEIIAGYRAALAPGSAIAMSHISDDLPDPVAAAEMHAMCEAYASSATPAVLRTRAQLMKLFGSLELVEPGLVDLADWPAASDARRSWMYGAVGVLPGMD